MINIQTCLIIDTETTGHKEHPQILEIGSILYEVTESCMLSCGSSLIVVDPDTINEAYLINKIFPTSTQICSQNQEFFLNWLQSAYKEADVIVAHNANYDHELIKGLPIANNWDKIWLCTYKDFEVFPEQYNGKRDLISLAQFYGVGISCSHRAIDDCLLLKEVFNRVPNLLEQFRIAQLPRIEAIAPKTAEAPGCRGFCWDKDLQGWVKKDKLETFNFPVLPLNEERKTFRAIVSFEQKELAKAWGFVWNNEARYWQRSVNPLAIDFFPFPVGELNSNIEIVY